MPRTPAGTIPVAPPEDEASSAQLAFLITLITERVTVGIELPKAPDFVTKSRARDLITQLKAQPRKQKGIQPTEEHLGLWTFEDGAYEVHQSESTGYFYTTVMTEDGWDIARGITSRVIEGGHRMTDEEIRAFGVKFVHCMICGRRLTNKVSQEYGIGPKCRGDM